MSKARAAIAQRAVAYVRVSTEEQVAHGHGMDGQERALRAFAESQGYELVQLVSDPAISGATRPADRPGFAQVIELAEQGAFTVLLVYKFDRLARQIVYAVTAANDLSERFGVVIRSVTEPIDTATPMGRTIFAILAGMAENERFAIRDRTAGGRAEKAAKGGFAGGPAPYGYERDGQGGLVVVPSEAAPVRRMFTLRANGLTFQAIADRLNDENVRGRRGGRWHAKSVSYVLDNPKYRGAIEYLFRWSGTEAYVLREGARVGII